MKITCCKCSKPFTTMGALVFSPPVKNNKEMSMSTVHKFHVCSDCWPKLLKFMEEDVAVKNRKSV